MTRLAWRKPKDTWPAFLKGNVFLFFKHCFKILSIGLVLLLLPFSITLLLNVVLSDDSFFKNPKNKFGFLKNLETVFATIPSFFANG
jgi:hypothetical protein